MLLKNKGSKPIPHQNQNLDIIQNNNILVFERLELYVMPTGISGIGVEGDVVEVKRGLFRNHLQPGGLAVYASPQDLKEKAKVFVCLVVNGTFLSVTKIESNSP